MTDTAIDRPAATSAKPAPGRRVWWRRMLVVLGPALVYLGARRVGVLILMVLADQHDTTARSALTSWDGQWFLGIADGGYTDAPRWLTDANGQRTEDTPLAFFPGYPKIVGWAHDLFGLPLGVAAFLVTLISGLFAAYGIARIGELIRGGSRRVGLMLVALFAASPMAVVLSMTYSEATFCALAAWTLVFLLRRHWLAAGALCGLAGLVRPTAGALVLAVLVAVVLFLVRERSASRWSKFAAVAAVVLAPLGLIGYLWWAGARIQPGQGFFAQLGGWSELQRDGWGTWVDGGISTVRFTAKAIARGESFYDIATVAVLLGAVALAVLCCVRRPARPEWPLLVYGIGVLAMDVASNGLMNSKARLLLPAFTLLIPLAISLAKRRTPAVVLTLAAVALVSGWFGAHALLVWKYAI